MTCFCMQQRTEAVISSTRGIPICSNGFASAFFVFLPEIGRKFFPQLIATNSLPVVREQRRLSRHMTKTGSTPSWTLRALLRRFDRRQVILGLIQLIEG
jgi:hypothetical protein